MSKADVVAIIDFETWFAVKQKGGKFDCGEDTSDCQGALHMLCARNMTGNAAYAQWWGFEDCLMSNQTVIPENAASCAHQTGLNYQTLATCVQGSLGQELLRVSAEMTVQAKVVWTPWFGVDDKYPDPPPAPPEPIDYLKVICEAYTNAGGSPLPVGCNSNSTVTLRGGDDI